MANKRDPNKRVFSTWVNKTELKRFRHIAEVNDVPMSDLVKYFIKIYIRTSSKEQKSAAECARKASR